MFEADNRKERSGSSVRAALPPSPILPYQHTIDTPYMVGPVHCYSTELDGELVLFDAGPPTDAGRHYLKQNVDLASLKHVIITHCHVDHYGQAAWLEQHSDAAVYLPQRDIMKALNHEKRMAKLSGFFVDMGFEKPFLEKFHESFKRNVSPPFPEKYLVAESDIPLRLGLEVVSCPGHSQSDLVYSTSNWAVTGDVLLRGIFQSPLLDVDIESGECFNNYEAYCSSIVKLAGLRRKSVLPCHRQKIESVDATILFYIRKTLRRVRQLQPHLGDRSIAEIISRVFSTMDDPFHIYFKTSEIVFMLGFLEHPELLGTALEKIGLFDEVAEDFHKVIDP